MAQMEQAYAAADLMLARCGASTVLETAAVGLPAVFVPYPYGNGEQARNAALVVGAGGGLLLDDADCTADWVATEIPPLLADPGPAGGNDGGSVRCCPLRRRGRLARSPWPWPRAGMHRPTARGSNDEEDPGWV